MPQRLNDLDNQAVAAVEAGDEDRFAELWKQMLDLVCKDGRELGDDELIGSDVILPPRDSNVRGGEGRVLRRGVDSRLGRGSHVADLDAFRFRAAGVLDARVTLES